MTQIEETRDFTATEGQAALSVRELWKIFGDKPEQDGNLRQRCSSMLRNVTGREQRQDTGCLIEFEDFSVFAT